jgi:hypothetical protein
MQRRQPPALGSGRPLAMPYTPPTVCPSTHATRNVGLAAMSFAGPALTQQGWK